MEKVLIGIPTYNEKLNISSLLLEIFSLYQGIDVLVIDDNSPDGSALVLESLRKKFSNFNFIIRKNKRGVGSAHIDIFSYAFSSNYDFLITMDADYTHQPLYIERLINKKDKADIIIGSRFLDKNGVSDWIIHRKLMTIFGHFLTKFFLGMPEDATGSFRCYNLKCINPNFINFIENKGYGFFIESLYLFTLNNYCFEQIPIILPKRASGESKMKLKDVIKTLSLIARLKIRKNQYFEINI